ALFTGGLAMAPAFRPWPLLLDEHVSYWIAAFDSPGSIGQRSMDQAATPPLSSIAQQVSLFVLGKSELAMRLPSIAAFFAAIFGIFAFGRARGMEAAGGAAALLFASIPVVVDECRLARPYALSVALGAWGLWASAQWARHPER